MKIGIAQTKPIKGDIPANVEAHSQFINLAISAGADCLFFPELSLTGYEPSLAKELAIEVEDYRLDVFQEISNSEELTIGAGIPIRKPNGIGIGMLIFQPNQARQLYSKRYLHVDENAFFVSGEDRPLLAGQNSSIGLAICYEISVSAHPAEACRGGATYYMASVAKSLTGTEKALSTLSEIAQSYAMTTFMANSIGPSDDFTGGGKSSIWNSSGVLLGQLGEDGEGILLLDSDTQKVDRINFHPG